MTEARAGTATTSGPTEAPWRRRYRAPRSTFPGWARDRADRLLYLSNHVGRFEVFAWDRRRDEHRQVTDRPEGTGYRVDSRLDPGGDEIWWWNDRKGDEFGTWTVERFEGGVRREAAPLEPAYSGGLAVGRTFAVIGRSTGEEGSTVFGHLPERNPIAYVERVRAPVLMLVGRNDPRCPSRSADVYEARLRELGKTFETYRYDAGHGSLVVDEQIKQMGIQIAFLAKHLGTGSPLS